MQSEASAAVSRNPRTATENQSVTHNTNPDTRRFASIFSLEDPETVPLDPNHATHEVGNHGSDAPSRRQLVVMLDNTASIIHAQVASVASAGEPATLSEAQQIIARYRAVHGTDHAPECASAEINEVSQFPDDQRSMYTIATSGDTQSAMDMMWRPKPKVHMHRADQRALVQAQSQAVAMMDDAGLKPTNKIQCRRRGCADILPGVEALKYHLHIHNIADMAAKCNNAPPSAACESSLAQHSISISKLPKRSHSRSKSSLAMQCQGSATYFPSRKRSAGSLFPSPLSPRESSPEAQHDVPSLTTVAKSFISDLSQSKSAHSSPTRHNESCFTTPSRGRRVRKQSVAGSVAVDSPSISMLLSSPSSPDAHGHHVFTPHTNFATPLALDPTMEGEDNHGVATPIENAYKVYEKPTGPRTPIRALSPTRAMSPIRNGIRRVLSIGCSVEPTSDL